MGSTFNEWFSSNVSNKENLKVYILLWKIKCFNHIVVKENAKPVKLDKYHHLDLKGKLIN